MKKSTLITLLINIYDDLDYCMCFAAKKKVEYLIEKLQKEGVEDE